MTKGNPDPATSKKLLETYGQERVNDIMSHILIIMLTNLHGNTIEALKLRLQGKGVEGSSFWQELGVTINLFKVMPVILFKIIKHKLFRTKKDRKSWLVHSAKL